MEFLKVFQEAQTLGLTKEEFIDVWKIESNIKLATQGKKKTPQETVSQEKQQTKHSSTDGLLATYNLHKPTIDVQCQECSHEIHANIQSVSNQLIEKHEQTCKQMQQKYDQMITEFRSRFEILSTHVSDTADSNASSLKLFFMQELELLKQELGKVIKEHAGNSRSSQVVAQQPKLSSLQPMAIKHKTSSSGTLTSITCLGSSQNNVHKEDHVLSGSSAQADLSSVLDPTVQNEGSGSDTSNIVPSLGNKQRDNLKQENVLSQSSEISAQQSGLSSLHDVVVQSKDSDSEELTSGTSRNSKQSDHDKEESILSGSAVSDEVEVVQVEDLISHDKSSGSGSQNSPRNSGISQNNPNKQENELPQILQQIGQTLLQQQSNHLKLSLDRSAEDKKEIISDMKEHETTSIGNIPTEIPKDVAVKSYSNAVTSTDKTHIPAVTNELYMGASWRRTSSVLAFDEGSVEATGSYAEAIASQMKEAQLSRTSSVSSITRPGSLLSTKDNKATLPIDQGSLIDKYQDFTMAIWEQTTVYRSKFIYCGDMPCIVRVQVTLDMEGGLQAELHVSRGVYDDNYKWPLYISSNGLVYHKGSKLYTPIWQLHPVACPKPLSSGGPFVFPFTICLSTSRHKYQDVTYKDLLKRNFVDDSNITFKWSLNVQEQ